MFFSVVRAELAIFVVVLGVFSLKNAGLDHFVECCLDFDGSLEQLLSYCPFYRSNRIHVVDDLAQ